MTANVWLASYPKSGNTWLRILIGSLFAKGDSIDINGFAENSGIASSRANFDQVLLIDSGLLTHEEAEAMRPAFHRQMVIEPIRDDPDLPLPGPIKFTKTHDAYTMTDAGEPLLGGAGGAKAAILIVRDPRDVAPSLANHMRMPLDGAIDFLNNPLAAFSKSTDRQQSQLRQWLPSWSGFAASWLDQGDIPVHLVRYEDLMTDAAGELRRVMAFVGAPVSEAEAQRAAGLAQFDKLRAQEQSTGFSEWFDTTGQGRFFRRGQAGGWREELSAAQVERVEAAHAPMMRRMGYDVSIGTGGAE